MDCMEIIVEMEGSDESGCDGSKEGSDNSSIMDSRVAGSSDSKVLIAGSVVGN